MHVCSYGCLPLNGIFKVVSRHWITLLAWQYDMQTTAEGRFMIYSLCFQAFPPSLTVQGEVMGAFITRMLSLSTEVDRGRTLLLKGCVSRTCTFSSLNNKQRFASWTFVTPVFRYTLQNRPQDHSCSFSRRTLPFSTYIIQHDKCSQAFPIRFCIL